MSDWTTWSRSCPTSMDTARADRTHEQRSDDQLTAATNPAIHVPIAALVRRTTDASAQWGSASGLEAMPRRAARRRSCITSESPKLFGLLPGVDRRDALCAAAATMSTSKLPSLFSPREQTANASRANLTPGHTGEFHLQRLSANPAWDMGTIKLQTTA